MTNESRPYIETCTFCGNGLLRFYRCSNCDEIVAVCDECELMWCDIEGVYRDPNLSSDSSWPQCPSCGMPEAEYEKVTARELEERDLHKFSSGESV